MKKFILGTLLGVLMSASVSPVRASFITLQTETRVSVKGQNVEGTVAIVNKGDEAARNVQVRVETEGDSWDSPLKNQLMPQETFSLNVRRVLKSRMPGRYLLLAQIFYTDANQYPFTALAAAYYSVGKDVVSGVFGTLQSLNLYKAGRTVLRLKNLEEKEKRCRIRFILPRELSAQRAAMEQTVPGRGEVEVPLEIKNFSALSGSAYPIYAAIEYEENNVHFAGLSMGTVRVLSQGASKGYSKILIWATGLILAILVILNARTLWRKG